MDEVINADLGEIEVSHVRAELGGLLKQGQELLAQIQSDRERQSQSLRRIADSKTQARAFLFETAAIVRQINVERISLPAKRSAH